MKVLRKAGSHHKLTGDIQLSHQAEDKTIILSGGGTGGHITPILAVAHELKRQDPAVRIVYIGEREGKFAGLLDQNTDIDEIKTVFAGKFRRYHGESWFKRLLDIKTNLMNVRDLFYFGIGFLQSIVIVKRLHPDAVFLKGGFVGVPVGLSAALWRIPFVTHDSDALPGLANRITARWAKYHATGMPAEFYQYPKDATVHVGVLVSTSYQPISEEIQKQYRSQIGIPEDAEVLLITGGSLGATVINQAIRSIVPHILENDPKLHVVHQVGKGKLGVYADFSHERLQVLEFLQPMHAYTGASDVVVSRAGANTIAELGVQGRAVILVPNPILTGGHQTKNAEHLLEKQAVVVVPESELATGGAALEAAITDLLTDVNKRKVLGQALQSITIPDAASKLATLLLEVAAK
jgi:UDP-N-acetylglucosamine--N-acetylmuramyl-(pentapeptide) pyrophosphoryl-undecaprenol N-acetylglucosamine transferase